MQWIKDGRYGLRYREHATRKTGVGRNKRPVRYYTAVFKFKGKVITDVYGYEDEFPGGPNEIQAIALRLKMNRQVKIPPFTYKDLLHDREHELLIQEQAQIAEAEKQEKLNRTVFGNLFSEYIESKPDTRATRECAGFYRKWLESDLHSKQLDEIKLLDLQRIQKRMEKAGRAPRTIKTIKEVVRQIYNYAIEHELYAGVKCTDNFLKKLKLNNQREEYYTAEQAEQLLGVLFVISPQTYQMATLSLYTGMRFGEIAGLRWQHVRLDRRTIFVADPKNKESRTVHMLDEIHEMFKEMDEGEPGELVFPDKSGNGVIQKISNTFPRAVDSLGFNEGVTDRRLKLGFHSLRHTAASWMANSGVESMVIAKVLGHKTLAMAMRYSHVNDNTVKTAMQTLQETKTESSNIIKLQRSQS
ncbi:tyrosine-type recombinase/integrase [Desulfosediminicola flagellatus]|uniref:tyrosine-type recombinase/integrase n=1 Tax=Desulfosediminicola flagellatus TaxID=2569541 RepID=UPI0010ACE8A7|nr:site-specific integrase [Desulfosediminicola flagellatus]